MSAPHRSTNPHSGEIPSSRESRSQLHFAEQERDDLLGQLQDALEQIDELRRKEREPRAPFVEVNSLLAERDAALAEADKFRRLAASAQRKLEGSSQAGQQRDELLRAHQEALRAAQEAGAQLAEMQRQITGIRQARDGAAAQNRELSTKVSRLEDELMDMTLLHEKAQQVQRALQGELSDLRHQIGTVTADRDATAAQVQDLHEHLDAARQKLLDAAAQSSAAVHTDNEHLAALQELRQQLGEVTRERDTVQARVQELVREIEELQSQLQELRVQQAATTPAAAVDEMQKQAALRDREITLLTARFEKQRVATIDLGARLEAAQREVLELSAKLAEARIVARTATARLPREQILHTPSHEPAEMAATGDGEIAETLDPKSAKSSLSEMRRCVQAFQKDPRDFSLLNELYSHAYGFSERARVSGFVALHRLGAALSQLTRGLYDVPDTITPSALRAVEQAIELLLSLVKDRNIAQIKDPAKAQIYVVEDDVGNGEAIRLSMEASGLRTTCAEDPVVALAELEAACFDLIFLDVNLPGMNGYDLCAHIRHLPGHAVTPVIFVSGTPVPEARTPAALHGGNDFISKPFNLHELTLKALTLIVKNQLGTD